ncbi:MAG: hypothetical protein WCC48_14130 [Anaeromyxobacteraceae bacterium]
MTTNSWRRVTAQLAVALAAITTPTTAWSWAEATHAYMAKQTDKAAGQVSANELCNRIFGSVAVDMFGYDFTFEGQTLHRVLHDRTMAIPAVPWDFAATDAERAFAYGLASHNNVWGTDATAHFDGITMGNRDGYVIAKANVLAGLIGDQVLPLVGGDVDKLLLVSHILVEYSVDLIVARADPAIGADLVAATSCAPAAGTKLLEDAWLPIFSQYLPEEAARATIGADAEDYRLWVADYGAKLRQPDAQQLVAGVVAGVAADFLGIPKEAQPFYLPFLTNLIYGALDAGQMIVAPDVMGELDATIGRVNAELTTRKITP